MTHRGLNFSLHPSNFFVAFLLRFLLKWYCLSLCSLLSYLCSSCFIAFRIHVDIPIFVSPLYCHREFFQLFFRRMMNNDAVFSFLPRDMKSSFYSTQLLCYPCRMWYAFLFLVLNICHKNYVRTIKFTILSDVLFRSSQFTFIRFSLDNMSKLFDICRLYDLFCYLCFVICFEIFITSNFQPSNSLTSFDKKCKFNFPVLKYECIEMQSFFWTHQCWKMWLIYYLFEYLKSTWVEENVEKKFIFAMFPSQFLILKVNLNN